MSCFIGSTGCTSSGTVQGPNRAHTGTRSSHATGGGAKSSSTILRSAARSMAVSFNVRCPSSPTLGQLGNRKQPRHLITIARIDAKDIPDGEVVIRLLHDPDLVSGAHIDPDDDCEMR